MLGFAVAGPASAQSTSLTVGSKDFSGAQAISQAYGQALKNKGYDISFKDDLGATEIVYAALKSGDLDGYADYQGTLLQYLGGTATGDSATNYKALLAKLAGTGIVASKPAPAVDVNGFYVTKDTAKKYKLKKVSDLTKVAPKLTFGGPPECETRDLCLGTVSQQKYGLKFSDVKKLDAGGPITVQALEDGDIDVGLLFTGSSVIPKDAVLLTDDKGLQPADNPVFLISKDKATAKTMKILNAVSAKLTTAAYNKMSLDISEREGRPGRRRRRLPEEERAGLSQRDARRRVARLRQLLSSPATTFTVVARITAPNRNDSSAWRSTARRMRCCVMSVSDTWKVMPIVNAVYAKSAVVGIRLHLEVDATVGVPCNRGARSAARTPCARAPTSRQW